MKLICKNSEELEAVNYFLKNISSETSSWVLNTPLILKLLRQKLSRSLLQAKINCQLTNFFRSCSLCSIYKSLLKFIFLSISIFLNLRVNVAISVPSIRHYQHLSLQLYLLGDDVCRILNVWAYLQQINYDHPFPSHVSANKLWLADFKILYKILKSLQFFRFIALGGTSQSLPKSVPY